LLFQRHDLSKGEEKEVGGRVYLGGWRIY